MKSLKLQYEEMLEQIRESLGEQFANRLDDIVVERLEDAVRDGWIDGETYGYSMGVNWDG